MQVADKVAVVTGAGSGIGRATACLLAKEGAHVVVTDVAEQDAAAVCREIVGGGGRAIAHRLDVTDEAAWQRVIDQIVKQQGRLDVAVNNAGVSLAKPLREMTLDQWRSVHAVNLDGVFLGTKHAAVAMANTGGGSIVNIASVSGIRPAAEASAYGSSKAAMRLFSKAAAIECADQKTGVRVNLVTPGGVTTPMWEGMEFFQKLVAQHGSAEAAFGALAGDKPSHAFFSPQEVALAVLYLASDTSCHLNGVELVLDRGHTG